MDINHVSSQILVEILCSIDSGKQLIKSCSLVCHRWHAVLTSPYFWISYMKRRYSYELPLHSRGNNLIDLRRLAVFSHLHGHNLVANPSGEHGFSDWKITQNGGERFQIERPPQGLIAPSDVVEAFLDTVRPPIKVSEYYNCRFDCASLYILKVQLLTSEQKKARDPFFRSGCIEGEETGYMGEDDRTTATSIYRIRHMEQWGDTSWRYIEHTFTDYPPGVRYVLFEHGGRDEQFWAGHYGSKMAKASVIVQLN